MKTGKAVVGVTLPANFRMASFNSEAGTCKRAVVCVVGKAIKLAESPVSDTSTV